MALADLSSLSMLPGIDFFALGSGLLCIELQSLLDVVLERCFGRILQILDFDVLRHFAYALKQFKLIFKFGAVRKRERDVFLGGAHHRQPAFLLPHQYAVAYFLPCSWRGLAHHPAQHGNDGPVFGQDPVLQEIVDGGYFHSHLLLGLLLASASGGHPARPSGRRDAGATNSRMAARTRSGVAGRRPMRTPMAS